MVESSTHVIRPLAERHDNTPWKCSDESRNHTGAVELAYSGAVVAIKGDWAEYCNTLGFYSWATVASPCFKCTCSKATMYDMRRMHAGRHSHTLITPGDYEQIADLSEIWVRLEKSTRLILTAAIDYLKTVQQEHQVKSTL